MIEIDEQEAELMVEITLMEAFKPLLSIIHKGGGFSELGMAIGYFYSAHRMCQYAECWRFVDHDSMMDLYESLKEAAFAALKVRG